MSTEAIVGQDVPEWCVLALDTGADRCPEVIIDSSAVVGFCTCSREAGHDDDPHGTVHVAVYRHGDGSRKVIGVAQGEPRREQAAGAAAVGQVWACRTNPNTRRIVTAVHGGYVDTTLGRTSVGALLRHWTLVDNDVKVGQTWASLDGRGHRTVTGVTRDNVETDRGLISRISFISHWRLVDENETEAAGFPGAAAPSDLNVDAARALLSKLGHQVTDDLEHDIDRAIDIERGRREHDQLLVALVLGHSRDAATHLRRHELLETVRDAALERDRCDTCPWTGVGTSIECGGAAGICPGNTRPTVENLLAQFPEPTP